MNDEPASTEPMTTEPSDPVGVAESGATPPHGDIDLAAIERDLTAVEQALPRLDDGSYWVDEVTGDEIPDDVLAANPVARRA
ncbi:MAG: hypothetical protein HKN41_11490 [Ilumatobacter sp.]|nr:hypothetical protein [Ilumatobacter sp.]